MFHILLTLDYEIHGNGEGDPLELMVEPTSRMLDQFERHGAKLTIMADVAEILKFRDYAERTGTDKFHFHAITNQLKDAVRRGHDVQLHLHSSYFNARYEGRRWEQDMSEYDFARLGFGRIREIVRLGKGFLESLLQPVNESYRCHVFRAANWSVSPSRDVVRALVENDIQIDTSVFKHGRREGLVNFNYERAFSRIAPWRADEEDICRQDQNSRLIECPIYCEERRVWAFLTLQRIQRACMSRIHRFTKNPSPPHGKATVAPSRTPGARQQHWMLRRHAWKADFNQCTGRQLISALQKAELKYAGEMAELPFVLIGHSKLFNRLNQVSLRPFLSYVAANPHRFAFRKFSELSLDKVSI